MPERPASGLDLMIKSNLQRVSRVVLFTEQMCQALRQEFHDVWAAETRTEPEAELVRRVELLGAEAQSARQLVMQLKGKPAPDQLKLLLGFDLKGMTAAAQGLEALAEERRAEREAAREATAPEATPEAAGLMGKLLRWASTPAVTQRLNPADARAAGTSPLPADPHGPARQAFEGAFKLVSGVLTYVGPRLLLLKVSFQTIGLPAKKAPWPTVVKQLMPTATALGMPAEQSGWLAKVARACYHDERAVQRGHMALVQWDEAQAMHQEASLLKMSLQSAAPERVGPLLATFDLGKFRAAVYQLSHLHISFRGIPTLDELFPPPDDAPATAGLTATA